MASSQVFERVEQLDALLGRYSMAQIWHGLVVARAEKAGSAALAAIRADLTHAIIIDDLLAGLTPSERGVLYEYGLAVTNPDSRKASGQYFTPDDVAEFMADRAAAFPPGMWIDPCCGVGNLSYWLVERQRDPAHFLATSLILADRDELALSVAAALLAIDFELDADQYRAVRKRAVVGGTLEAALPDFDYAIVNPPYVVVPPDTRFRTSSSRDLYAYFLERLLEQGSGVVAITPQSYTTSSRFASLRQLLMERLPQLDIYCFDNMPACIFRGVKFGSSNTNTVNSVRAAILVGRADGEQRRRITPLLRWRAHERAELFERADEFLAELQPSDEAFPKIAAALIPLHQHLVSERTVGDLTVKEVTDWWLDVPATPRYFLSAVKRVLNRSGSHRLYFASPADRDLAYVVLNSSVAYWWWIAYEGGMTVSPRLLRSIPLPIQQAPAEAVVLLERSEVENVVVKMNAGKPNENVKHPWSLIRTLNTIVCPGFDEALIAQHTNSHLHVTSPVAAFGDRA